MKKKMFGGAESTIFSRAKEHRGERTFAEEILWQFLRTKPLGFKFRRQHPFSIYILDFYCHSLRLAIEVDGSIHKLDEVKEKDDCRQKQLEQEGLNFLRFSNEDIITKPELVIQQIENALKEQAEKSKKSTV
jgi:very-short-patch-repair endonuclease